MANTLVCHDLPVLINFIFREVFLARKSRIKSASSIYHIVVRGLDRQVMFESDKDYIKYLDILELHKEECNFELFAYCLMSNHVHLLIRISNIPLSTIFKKINTQYAIWFNMKYQRTGHLQQERYYSEPVETEQYFLTVLRYIHRNPLKAGLEHKVGESYKWSSIYEYIHNDIRLINTNYALNLISIKNFLQYMNEGNSDDCMDIESMNKRLPDDVARTIIYEISGCKNATEFQNLSLVDRNKFINIIYKKRVSLRQINRLTGTSKGIIQRAIY